MTEKIIEKINNERFIKPFKKILSQRLNLMDKVLKDK